MWLTSVLRFLRRLQKPPTIHPAMPWSFRRDFHIDLSASYGSYLLESNLRPVALQTPPDLVAGDKLPVRIYLWERDATTGDPVAVVTPEGTSMVFAGRPANAPLDSSLLFLSSNLAESETEPGVWEGTLDLNTVELHNHLASQTTGEITILGEIELRSSDATPNRQSIQFDLTARRQVYAGVEGESAALLARSIGNAPPAQNWLVVTGAGMPEYNGYYYPAEQDTYGFWIWKKITNISENPTETWPVELSPTIKLSYLGSRYALSNGASQASYYNPISGQQAIGNYAVSVGVGQAPAPSVAAVSEPTGPPYFRTERTASGVWFLYVYCFDPIANAYSWQRIEFGQNPFNQ